MNDFASHSGIRWNGHVGMVEYGGGDRSMVVIFYNKPVHNPIRSNEQGSPWYDDVVYVRIHPPGERLNIVDRKANDSDKRRWPVQWAQFQQQKEQIPEGTPVDLLYPDHPSIAAMLRANGVHTIQQCAELSANAIESIGMGAQRYVNAAKKYLEQAEKGQVLAQMRHMEESHEREVSSLKKTIEQLKQQVDAVATNATKVTEDQILNIVAQAMGRPQHLPGKAFDPQQAMIDANNQASRAPGTRLRRRVKE